MLLSYMLFSGVSALVAEQVDYLQDVEEHRNTRNHEHEEDEDGLLCRTRNVTLGAAVAGTRRRHSTVEVRDHEYGAENVELAHGESHFQEDLEDQLGHVSAKEDAFYLHLPSVICILPLLQYSSVSAVLHLLHHLLLFVNDVDSMAQVDQGGCGNKGDLQDPVMNIGYWEHPVVAGMLASWFQGVTVELRHFISPNFVCSSTQDKDPEQEEDTHPDLPHHSGVRLDLVQ